MSFSNRIEGNRDGCPQPLPNLKNESLSDENLMELFKDVSKLNFVLCEKFGIPIKDLKKYAEHDAQACSTEMMRSETLRIIEMTRARKPLKEEPKWVKIWSVPMSYYH